MMGHPSSRMDFPAETLALRVLFVDVKPPAHGHGRGDSRAARATQPLARRVRARPAHQCPYRGKLGTRPGPAQCPGALLIRLVESYPDTVERLAGIS